MPADRRVVTGGSHPRWATRAPRLALAHVHDEAAAAGCRDELRRCEEGTAVSGEAVAAGEKLSNLAEGLP
eukprot:COSAG01_NODE_22749_length_842_cov_3.734859_1_plen_70_part_00